MTTRKLIDLNTDKIWIAVLSDNTIKIESGKNGKTKTKEKNFDSNSEAQAQFEKLEWEMLKKGYVLRNPNTSIGEPALHYFVGKFYTGCLSLSNTKNGIITNKNGDFYNNELDSLIFINQDGIMLDTVKLPKFLPWHIEYCDINNSLFIDLDHIIYQYDIETREFVQITTKCEKPTSFISVKGSRVAYCTHPQMVVKDIKTGEVIFSRKIDCGEYAGYMIQLCGVLSKDGHILGLCNKWGEIQLIDTDTGELIDVIITEYKAICQMEFVSSGNILAVFGDAGLHFYNLENKQELSQLFGDLTYIHTFCFNQNQDKLAVLNRNKVQVYNFVNRENLCSFRIEHMVKSANIAFIGDKLGVRTDYGCLSVYTV